MKLVGSLGWGLELGGKESEWESKRRHRRGWWRWDVEREKGLERESAADVNAAIDSIWCQREREGGYKEDDI